MIKQLTSSPSQKNKTLGNLYNLIYKLGPISKSELIVYAEITQTTCTRLIDELIDSNLIIDAGFGKSSGGRKPILYDVKSDSYYTFGIDISRTYTTLLLMDFKLNIIDKENLLLDATTTPETIISFLTININKMIENHDLPQSIILGIGIGSIGPLNREEGIILDPVQVPSPGWKEVQIKQELENKLKLDVLMDYGANTALLAEYQQPIFNKFDNVASVIKGVGSRTGLIIDRHLVRGSDKLGRYGQGHMIVDIHGKKCVCGSYGCVQAYSSILAIVEDVTNLLKEGKESMIRDWVEHIEDVTFNEICEAVNLKDPLCMQVIQNAAYYAGVGLSNLINVLHPDLILLGGPTYTGMDLFYQTVKETALSKSKVMYPEHETIITKGKLRENAIAIGAGSLIINHNLPT